MFSFPKQILITVHDAVRIIENNDIGMIIDSTDSSLCHSIKIK